MLYFALASLSCALVATLLGYAGAAVVFAQLGEVLFVVAALAVRDSGTRTEAMAAAMG
ncbi:MAG: hypothetical protein V4719_17845 [Planctomycetota bacterium]|jgi:uncharacterized membrane protein YtjA (UPF0391 family)